VPTFDESGQATVAQLVLHQAKRILVIDRPKYRQQQLLITEIVQLQDHGIAQVGKHGNAAITQIHLAKIGACAKIQMPPVLTFLVRLATGQHQQAEDQRHWPEFNGE